MPAIIDTAPADGGAPLSVFESGAILLYLADKTGTFIPADLRGRNTVLEWLFWQMGGLGPMLGQNHHFNRYAPEKLPYAIARYVNETNRLYGVLNKRLEGRAFIAGDDYSIADMACYPWIVPWKVQEQNLDDFVNRASLCEGRAVFEQAGHYGRGPQDSIWPDRREHCCKGIMRARS